MFLTFASVAWGQAYFHCHQGEDHEPWDPNGYSYTLVGSASAVDMWIELTPDASNQAGAVWLDDRVPFHPTTTGRFEFEVQIDGGAVGSDGDGFALVFQNESSTALGLNGNGLGFEGIDNSVIVEFDTIPASSDDPDNSIGLNLDGARISVSSVPVTPDFNDGALHRYWVRYTQSTHTLQVWMDSFGGTPTFEASVDLLAKFPSGAWVGVTAATGGNINSHRLGKFTAHLGTDADEDFAQDWWDNCFSTPNSNQADRDDDDQGDACDPCPDDANDDSDGDGACDGVDVCPGFDDAEDADGDQVPDGCDLCEGDDASGDQDQDGVCDDLDPCDAGDLDTDSDGVADACDLCPFDALDDADGDGICGDVDQCDGFDDGLDSDSDGTADGCDSCPDDPLDDEDQDGLCGDVDACPGFDDGIDTDDDGTADGCDPCPRDPLDDEDLDGLCGDVDACPGFDDGVDADGDGIADGCDLCTGVDEAGDTDTDGVCDDLDQCPAGDDTQDLDADGIPNACDTCPRVPGLDDDGDGLCGADDRCLDGDDALDSDGDFTPDACDVCPESADHSDGDGDGSPDCTLAAQDAPPDLKLACSHGPVATWGWSVLPRR